MIDPAFELLEARKQIPEALGKLRDKYPVIVSRPDDWEKVGRLVARGEEQNAEELIKSSLSTSPRLLIRNRVAIRHRILRRAYLEYQRDLENGMKDRLQKLSDKISIMLINASDADGIIGFAKLNDLLDRLKTHNTEAWSDIRVMIQQGIRQAIKFGLDVTMKSAQWGIEDAEKQTKEMSGATALATNAYFIIQEAKKKATLSRTDVVYKTIFTRVQKNRLKRGLFRRQEGTGLSISRRVWDLRDGHLTRMRRVIAAGIGNGRPAAAIAKDIKGMTTVGKLSKAELRQTPTERGVYKSAYKNALRLARTETNQAYQEAEIEYAKAKGYKKMWNVSVGKRVTDVCDDLAGNIYDAEDVPPLPHPNCSCFLTTVLPEA